MTAVQNEPGTALAATRQLDGLALLEAVKRGEAPPPPVARLLGFEIRTLDRGSAAFAMTPTDDHYNGLGMVHGGISATLLDTAIGCSVQTRLPAGTGYTTLDLSVRYLRPVTTDTGRIVATAHVVHLGRRTATAEATLTQQATGRLLATATSSLLVVQP